MADNTEDKIVENLIKRAKEANKPFKIKVKVIAGAKQNAIEAFNDEIIKIKINKPAVEGKANKAIIEYLSDVLKLPKSNIIITKGDKNSIKDLQITPKNHII